MVGLGRAAGPLRPAAVSVCPVFVGQCGAQHLSAQTWAGPGTAGSLAFQENLLDFAIKFEAFRTPKKISKNHLL